jgi:hypothetical protein
MESNQIKLLYKLAKKLKSQENDKTKALSSLQSAKILDKNGRFTKPYRNLEKVVLKTK